MSPCNALQDNNLHGVTSVAFRPLFGYIAVFVEMRCFFPPAES
jgi:hypothetical protein